MRLKDNKKFIASRIKDLAKLILKERIVNSRVARRFKNLVRITKRPARSVQLVIVWTLLHAHPENKLPTLIYLDIQGYIDAANAEDNWAYPGDLPAIADIVAAIERGVDQNDTLIIT